MVERLVGQLDEARERAIERLAGAGLAPIAQPRGGMFVSAGWAQAPSQECNGKLLAEQALKSGILLAPGEFFQLRQPPSIWFRFNVAYSDSPQLRNFLQAMRREYGIS
jgi:DNA-binding transcriptional MocR family regulator